MLCTHDVRQYFNATFKLETTLIFEMTPFCIVKQGDNRPFQGQKTSRLKIFLFNRLLLSVCVG